MTKHELGPLPEFAASFTPRWLGDEGGFNATQMHAYALAEVERAVMAERERAAEWLKWYDGAETRRAEAIRNGDHWDAAIRAQSAPKEQA